MTTLRVREKEATLLEVLDCLLDKGVVVAGDLTLCLAEVNLLFASLRLVLTSVDKLWEGGPRPPSDLSEGRAATEVEKGLGPLTQGSAMSPESTPRPPLPASGEGDKGGEGLDPDRAANGLAQLVLTLVELLRRLLEREVLRRMERGTLTPRELERLGQALARLEWQVQQLKQIFDLRDHELNLDLGPLGKLM